MKESERRQGKRSSIRVLVNCLPSGRPVKRNGHLSHGWEMWAQDLGDDGVGLQWSQAWASRNYVPDFKAMDERPVHKNPGPMEPPKALLKKGCIVVLEGLVYNEKGSKPMRGKIQWYRAAKNGRKYEFGVHIISSDHRSYFRALTA